MRGIYTDPRGRLDRTLAYFLTVAVADGRTAIAASDHLMRVHAAATGIEPISGKRYSANNPSSQLWIHVTGWHSVLKCYEMYGPGPLSAAEEKQYWAESVIAAGLQTCKPADVPSSRAEVRDYFAAVRPHLCTSERAHQGMHYLLRTPRRGGNARFWALSRLMAPATIATLPAWMGKLGGFSNSLPRSERLMDRPFVLPYERRTRRVGPCGLSVTRSRKPAGFFASTIGGRCRCGRKLSRRRRLARFTGRQLPRPTSRPASFVRKGHGSGRGWR